MLFLEHLLLKSTMSSIINYALARSLAMVNPVQLEKLQEILDDKVKPRSQTRNKEWDEYNKRKAEIEKEEQDIEEVNKGINLRNEALMIKKIALKRSKDMIKSNEAAFDEELISILEPLYISNYYNRESFMRGLAAKFAATSLR